MIKSSSSLSNSAGGCYACLKKKSSEENLLGISVRVPLRTIVPVSILFFCIDDQVAEDLVKYFTRAKDDLQLSGHEILFHGSCLSLVVPKNAAVRVSFEGSFFPVLKH